MLSYPEFFKLATGKPPFPYQERMAVGTAPHVVDIPTGLGKTAAVALAWLWRWYRKAPERTRRLVYCLPMRVLVEQTRDEIQKWLDALQANFAANSVPLPCLHILMGSDVDKTWDERPESPEILVGTQDMLLSRALNRGYAVSRYRWPMQFAWLNNDATWIFDETQLMGVGVETSAQLQGLRERIGTLFNTHSTWMSATLTQERLLTIDHPIPADGWKRVALDDADREHETVRMRTESRKTLEKAPFALERTSAKGDYVKQLADFVLQEHCQGTFTLVIVNNVQRAQELFSLLLKQRGKSSATGLIHSRFRRPDRKEQERFLTAEGDRIIVSTQAIEAGVDVSSETLITELAPWSSMVQRFGRCKRYGGPTPGRVFWIDVTADSESLPYEYPDLIASRRALEDLEDVGPARVRDVKVEATPMVRPVLRRRDLLDLFDTTTDLSGQDIDISPYIRDGDDTDVQIYWREFDTEPGLDDNAPADDELCSVSLLSARAFAQKQTLRRWDMLGEQWSEVDRNQIRPGHVLLANARDGGYTVDQGWSPRSRVPVPPVLSPKNAPLERMSGDPASHANSWVTLDVHLDDAAREARALATSLELSPDLSQTIETAARWHDVGKAHDAFQNGIEADRNGPLQAKSPNPTFRVRYRMDDDSPRRGFRHELASALAWLQQADGASDSSQRRDLVAYLIAAHHGKVRLSIRSMPDENKPLDGSVLFARGIWQNDALPPVTGLLTEEIRLSLALMRLGPESWASRMLALRDEPSLGPFRLGYLEALVRVADWRASMKVQTKELVHA